MRAHCSCALRSPQGPTDEVWDKPFYDRYDRMVDYSEDPEPIKWPIPPVDKDVLEESIQELLDAERTPRATWVWCWKGGRRWRGRGRGRWRRRWWRRRRGEGVESVAAQAVARAVYATAEV